jgi:hypothetical protein
MSLASRGRTAAVGSCGHRKKKIMGGCCSSTVKSSTVVPWPRGGSSRSPQALVTAANGGRLSLHTHLVSDRQHLPSEKDVAMMGDEDASRWLAAVHVCIDAIWEPLIRDVERLIDSSADPATWDQLTTADILRLVVKVTGEKSDDSQEQQHVREVTRSLLAMGGALWQRQCVARTVTAAGDAEAAFCSTVLCRLLGLLSIALCRIVGVEDPTGLQRRLGPWQDLRRDFGLEGAHLCALLDGQAKGLLAYCAMVSRGDARLKLLDIERGSALGDAWSRWMSSPFAFGSLSGEIDDASDLWSVKVFPRFVGEDGEGHGPRKEFFALAGAQLLSGANAAASSSAATSVSKALLPYAAASRQHWFDPERRRTSDAEQLCRFAGWLMGQSVNNRSPLQQCGFPPLLFRCLLGTDASGALPPASLELLEEFDPSAVASLRGIEKLKQADFEAMCELEDLEPKRTSRAQYVASACERLLFGEQVRWQLEGAIEGFRRALPLEVLHGVLFTPRQLAHAVCGAGDGGEDAPFSIISTFRIAHADGDFEGSEPLCEALWRVLEQWEPREKRRFVKFVTGADRLPPAGGEVISLQLPFVDVRSRRRGLMLGMLPQAHTCDNLLELPNYWEALCEQRGVPPSTRGAEAATLIAELDDLIHCRMQTAVNECDVYGLDEAAGGGATGRGGVLRDRTNMGLDAGAAGATSRCGLGLRANEPLGGLIGQPLTSCASRHSPAQRVGGAGVDVVDDELEELLAGTATVLNDDEHYAPRGARGDAAMVRGGAPTGYYSEQEHERTITELQRPPTGEGQRSAVERPLTGDAVRTNDSDDPELMSPRRQVPRPQRAITTAATMGIADAEDDEAAMDDLIAELETLEDAPQPSPTAGIRKVLQPVRPSHMLERGLTEESKLTAGDVDLDLDLELENLEL